MKRALLLLPMFGIASCLVAEGLYSALSDYYPEPTRPFGFLLAAWGVLMAVFLSHFAAHSKARLLRIIAIVAAVPTCIVLVGHIASGFLLGWELVAGDITAAFIFSIVLTFAYLCATRVVVDSVQASNSAKPTPFRGATSRR